MGGGVGWEVEMGREVEVAEHGMVVDGTQQRVVKIMSVKLTPLSSRE